MTTTIRSSADGSKSYIAVSGTDVVTVGTQGIEAGSFKPGAITANDFADGALIENAPVGIGYGIGAGGTVTQATSKSTAVTLNKPCGQITMNAAALGSGTTVSFSVNNFLVATSDVVVVNLVSGYGSNSDYRISVSGISAGVFNIVIENRTGGTLSNALVINFAIIKGATS